MATFRELIATWPRPGDAPLPPGVSDAALRTELAALANPACPSGMPVEVYAPALGVETAEVSHAMRRPRSEPLDPRAAALIERALRVLAPPALASKLLRDETYERARTEAGVERPGPLGDQLRNALRGTLAGKVRQTLVALVGQQPGLLGSAEATLAVARDLRLPAVIAAAQVREALAAVDRPGPPLREVALAHIAHSLAQARERGRAPHLAEPDVLARAFAISHLPAGSLDRPADDAAREAMEIAISAVLYGGTPARESTAAYLLAQRGRIVAAARREARLGRQADVEDIAQETTARLLAYVDTRPERTHTAGLVDTLAARVAAEMYRSAPRTVPFSALGGEADPDPAEVPSLDAADLVFLADRLTRAIDAEAVRTREVEVDDDPFAGARRAERLATLASAKTLVSHLFEATRADSLDIRDIAGVRPDSPLWLEIERWVGEGSGGPGPAHRVRQLAAVLNLAASAVAHDLRVDRSRR